VLEDIWLLSFYYLSVSDVSMSSNKRYHPPRSMEHQSIVETKVRGRREPNQPPAKASQRKKKKVVATTAPSPLVSSLVEQQPIGVITQILSYLDYRIGSSSFNKHSRYVSKKWLAASRYVPHITLNWVDLTRAGAVDIEEQKPMISFRSAIQQRPRVISFMNLPFRMIDPLLKSPKYDSIWSSIRKISIIRLGECYLPQTALVRALATPLIFDAIVLLLIRL
jgi:hypothetical protein